MKKIFEGLIDNFYLDKIAKHVLHKLKKAVYALR